MLKDQYQMPEQVLNAIDDIQDKHGFGDGRRITDLEDSVLYLSSNWSAGGLSERRSDGDKE